ncbi:hypothetical protein [Bradyrhizobium sp. CSA207]|uniref:hypothetical protein n=1 Tax=Bradyrhizobium sp. CSA207 TaxID=2698826 RepID=UPI0023B166C4|nr:hypothetical protein [Bradyrhizobium sp. CSA207]
MNNDFLDNLANGLMGRQTAVLVCLSKRLFQVTHLVAVSVRRIRVEFDHGRGDGSNLCLDFVALGLQGCQAVA